MEGAIAFVPVGAGSLDSYRKVWALVPRSDDPTRSAFPKAPAFEPARNHLPLHHPVIRIPARNLVGAGESDTPVWLRLGCQEPALDFDRCEPASGYDISIEPFAPSTEAPNAVTFAGIDSIPTVYRTPPDASGRAGSPSDVAPELLAATPGLNPVLAARLAFQNGEDLVVDTLPEALVAFAANTPCTGKPDDCRATLANLPSSKAVPAAVGVMARRDELKGNLLLTLRDFEGRTRHRYLLSSRGAPELLIRLSSLTAEDLLGLPSEGLHVHSEGGMHLIDHFVLFYLLAKPDNVRHADRFWFPAVKLTAEGGSGGQRAKSRVDKHGKPWCSTPGAFR
jgi:hypothetical protein